MTSSYAPGTATALVTPTTWLLIAAAPQDARVGAVWAHLDAGRDATDATDLLAGAAYALVTRTTDGTRLVGSPEVAVTVDRGNGPEDAARLPDGWTGAVLDEPAREIRLTLGEAPDAPTLPLLGGVVAAQVLSISDPAFVARAAAPTSLGSLVFSTGEEVSLDRDVVVGRAPAAGSGDPEPRLVQIRNPAVSRMHALFTVAAGQVLVRDLGSSNNTTITVPGGTPVQLRAHEDHLLQDGTVIGIADAVEVLFEAQPGTDEDPDVDPDVDLDAEPDEGTEQAGWTERRWSPFRRAR